MTWMSHMVMTGLTMYAATRNPYVSAGVAVFSITPDAVEGPIWNYPFKWLYRAQHRHLSHWFIIYLIMALIAGHGLMSYGVDLMSLPYLDLDGWLRILEEQDEHFWTTLIYILGLFVAAGSFFHIAEDAICGKVPSISLDKRVGIKLFTVGTIKETLFVSIYCAVLLYLMYG